MAEYNPSPPPQWNQRGTGGIKLRKYEPNPVTPGVIYDKGELRCYKIIKIINAELKHPVIVLDGGIWFILSADYVDFRIIYFKGYLKGRLNVKGVDFDSQQVRNYDDYQITPFYKWASVFSTATTDGSATSETMNKSFYLVAEDFDNWYKNRDISKGKWKFSLTTPPPESAAEMKAKAKAAAEATAVEEAQKAALEAKAAAEAKADAEAKIEARIEAAVKEALAAKEAALEATAAAAAKTKGGGPRRKSKKVKKSRKQRKSIKNRKTKHSKK